MPLISIIVPVYKVEPYLRRCLEGIALQTFTEYECILVDDGSPDGCPKICDEYVARDSRFKVIHKKQNEGLPMARKNGLDAAISDLIFHVDSDDFLEPQALEWLYNKQQQTDAAIVLGGFKSIPKNKTSFYSQPVNLDSIVYFLLSKNKFLWGRLYSKKLFENYIVPKSNLLEDGFVNVQVFSQISADKIEVLDKVVYVHNDEAPGLINSWKKRRFNSYLDDPMIKTCLEIVEIIQSEDDKNQDLRHAINFFMLYSGIIPYIRNYNKITKADITFFYNEYYLNCKYSALLGIWNSIIVPVFKFSTVLGKIYILLLNFTTRILH
ncbi:hypothetical protein FACS189444_3420 [Spirochaetia bacterium]|nr:hypothetical protein FACS189444_3420 [Spirochaetia bacterium]